MDLLSSSSDWDLLAVVRGCYSSTTTTSPDLQQQQYYHHHHHHNHQQLPPLSHAQEETPDDELIGFPSLAGELHNLFNPFYSDLSFSSTPTPTTPLHSNLSSATSPRLPTGGGGGEIVSIRQTSPQQQQQYDVKPSQFVDFRSTTTTSSSCTTTSANNNNSTKFSIDTINRRNGSTALSPTKIKKSKKNLPKKVVHNIPTSDLSSDKWAWRKYGQKPIKGSPYPRGYYRCSSCKGCLARKQVERNRSDPKMFIVTYTGEHNHAVPTHRNSLAGTTRQQQQQQHHNKNNTKPSSLSADTLIIPSTSMTSSSSRGDEHQHQQQGAHHDSPTGSDTPSSSTTSAIGNMLEDQFNSKDHQIGGFVADMDMDMVLFDEDFFTDDIFHAGNE